MGFASSAFVGTWHPLSPLSSIGRSSTSKTGASAIAGTKRTVLKAVLILVPIELVIWLDRAHRGISHRSRDSRFPSD